MKRAWIWPMLLMLLLCGCGAGEMREAAPAQPEEAAAEEAPQISHRNPWKRAVARAVSATKMAVVT